MDPSKLKHIRPIRGYHQAFQAYVMSTQFIPCCVSLRGTIMSATIVAHHCLGAPSYSTFVAMNSGHHPSANSGLLMNSLTACISHEPYMGQLPTASFPSTCSSRNMQSQNGNIMRISVHIYIYIYQCISTSKKLQDICWDPSSSTTLPKCKSQGMHSSLSGPAFQPH